ncbi:hypothetical protein [Peribacillus kribbensis]|uniref:hypothetical protein n=1 Tax=Peribacillus kribbensis TaxID=356658 RepID=UPI00040B50E9|nr:hypothetical protein [Peribacillus kribbensis]
MKKLNSELFGRVKAFIKKNARPVDVRLYEYYFEGGDPALVEEALLHYQNQDGGFGHSLEPDFRLEHSSPMASTIAFQYAREMHLTSESPLIQKGIQYFLHTYDQKRGGWHGVPEEVNDVPHAPWWNFDAEKGHTGAASSWANPSAEITGYLLEYSELVPKLFLDTVKVRALEELDKLEMKMEMHDFLCYQRLFERLEVKDKQEVLYRLRESAREITPRSRAGWENYGLTPLQIATSPESPFADLFKEVLPDNLDYELDRLTPEGAWNPGWSWFGQYEEEWKAAEKDWKGYLTVKMLKVLSDFNRLEQ